MIMWFRSPQDAIVGMVCDVLRHDRSSWNSDGYRLIYVELGFSIWVCNGWGHYQLNVDGGRVGDDNSFKLSFWQKRRLHRAINNVGDNSDRVTSVAKRILDHYNDKTVS